MIDRVRFDPPPRPEPEPRRLEVDLIRFESAQAEWGGFKHRPVKFVIEVARQNRARDG